jgi:hypothetical protein
MENGTELSIDTLYPFSQVTLAHVARVLGTYGIDVEVIGIPARLDRARMPDLTSGDSDGGGAGGAADD